MKILIVDDSASNRKWLREMLEAEGQQILEATDGKEALSVLKQERLDAILSDILMPRMDGHCLCSEIRSQRIYDALPFLFHSRIPISPSDRKLSLELGADGFVDKDFCANTILGEIQRVSSPDYKRTQPITKAAPQAMKEYNAILIKTLEDRNIELETIREHLQQANESLKRVSTAVEQAADNVVITDRDGNIEYVNPAFEKVTGYAKEEVIGKTPRFLKSGTYDQEFYKQLWKTILSGKTFRFQFINRQKNGKYYYSQETIAPIKDESGNITHFVSTGTDVSQSKQAEKSLLDSEMRYHHLFKKNPFPMWVYDAETLAFLDINEAAVRYYGYSADEFLKMTVINMRPPEAVPEFLNYHKTMDEKPQSTLTHAGVWKHRKKDGTLVDVEIAWSSTVFQGKNAQLAIINDVTEQQKAERALREQARLSAFSADVGLALIQDAELTVILQACCGAFVNHLNAAYARIWTLNAGADFLELQATAGPHTRLDGPHARVRVGESHVGLIAQERKPYLTNMMVGDATDSDQDPERKEGLVSFAGYPLTMGDDLVGVVAMFARTQLDELTLKAIGAVANQIALAIHQHQTRKALRQAEEKYRSIFDNAPQGIFETTPDGRYITANHMEAQLLGYDSPEELMREITDVGAQLFVRPEQRAELQKRMMESDVVRAFEFEVNRKDGSKIWISEDIRTVRDVNGNILRYEGFSQDITTRKRAIEEKEALEKQLLQAQKIEAIGQLAGGVAHDYNNTLMAIGGYTELLLLKLPADDPLQQIAMEIQKGVTRGGNLTRQLLAFSRKQVLVPQTLDLNQAITKIEDMLRRLIGEDIHLHISLARDLCFIKADPGQIDQVIINMAVNARDAMPDGGVLIIETANVTLDEEYVKSHAYVKPGDHILLSISDTGMGMDEETATRIFEPFFTTKGEGKGTGLGLSTVYGIVKQSGGHITVYSQVNQGTVFKVYFPIAYGIMAKESSPSFGSEPIGKGEVILLVDDNEGIRSSLGSLLQLKGYRVFSVESGQKALETAREFNDPIHLLVTDVVMPEMGGQELAHQLRKEHAAMKVLYMSGYIEEAIRRQGELEPGSGFISKPASSQALLKKIRELLEQ